MAISIDYPSGVIFVPKADTIFVGLDPLGNEVRDFDILQFWRDLRAEEDTPEGRAFPRILDSNPPDPTYNLARSVNITDYYFVEFDDASGTDAYKVELRNANTNTAVRRILNLVQVSANNSSGLAETGVSGLTAGEAAQLTTIEDQTLDLVKLRINKMILDKDTGEMTIFDDNDTDPLYVGNIWEDKDALQIYRQRGIDRRDRMIKQP